MSPSFTALTSAGMLWRVHSRFMWRHHQTKCILLLITKSNSTTLPTALCGRGKCKRLHANLLACWCSLRAPLCQNTASQSCRLQMLFENVLFIYFLSLYSTWMKKKTKKKNKTGICCNHYISSLRSPWGWARLMCRHHAHGHEAYTPARTQADLRSRFVDQVWKKRSQLSLWDSHTCCTGLHTENKSAQSSIVTDRTPQRHIMTIHPRKPHRDVHGGKKSTQRNADEQMGPQTITLTPLHSLNLSVITADASLSWFNFSDAKTKSASFRWRKEKKPKQRLKGTSSRFGWKTISSNLLLRYEQSKTRAAREQLKSPSSDS